MLLGWLLAGAWVRAAAPVASWVQITEDEGLAHSDVRAIAQDPAGFMWFGLRLGGLARYDGYELVVRQHDAADPQSMGNQIVWALLVDRAGALWIGTEGGLDRYDRQTDTFRHYRHEPGRAEGLPNNVVTCIYEDASGRLWVGTREGLARLDDRERGTFRTFLRPQVVEGSTAKDTIRSIVEDPTTGLLWLGTSDGLAAFDPRTGAFLTCLHDPGDLRSLSHNAVNKVVRDTDGAFWALTEQGANRFRPRIERVERHAVQEPRLSFDRVYVPGDAGNPGANFVRDALVDRKGRLWFATRGGVHLFDRATGKFTSYRRVPGDPSSLNDDLVQAIFEDRAGNIWVGTYAGGVNRLRSDAKPFRTHRHNAGDPRTLSENRIAGLAFDPAGRLWASTVNGLNRLDDDGWTRFLHDPQDSATLPSNDLSTIAIGSDGVVWVGSNYRGIYRYDGVRFSTYATSPSNVPAPNGTYSFTGGQVNSLLPDPAGGVWVGARSYGLDWLEGERFRHYAPQAAAPGQASQPTTNPLLGWLAENGELWFATETEGLVRLDRTTGRFAAYVPPDEAGEGSRSLHCLAAGDHDTLWLGAADGLLKFDRREQRFVRQYGVRDGLPNPAVMTIVRDRRGHLWLGTANGLSDFDPVRETFRNYDKADGLPASVFAQRAGALGPDGRVYLGTRAGIVEFTPEELEDNPVPPPVVLTELRWIGAPPNTANGRPRAAIVNLGDTLHVPAGQPGFHLRFSALDFSAPEKNQFRYRLEGWDNDWNTTSARARSATYTSLPPGSYTFRVQGSNADGVWNTTGAAVRIEVAPHWWQTLWLRLAAGAIAFGVLGGGLRWRMRVVRQRNAELERQVSLRTAELQYEVTVRQQVEADLRESHARLEQRVSERTAQLARINASLQEEIAERLKVEAQLRQSQKMEAIGQLAGGIAHDFNNLLTVILGQSELLNEPDLTPVERENAGRDIRAAAQRATNLTRQLLVFSRHQAMQPETLDLNDVVAGVGKLLRHVIGERIELESRTAGEPLRTHADLGMLEQVVLNMAVNARDAMPKGGRLVIATSAATVTAEHCQREPRARPGPHVRLTVSDTGCGIPPEVLPQIFEPFYTTKAAGKGTGLGLAISLGIVLQHQGWIEVDTRLGEGTTFHVYLPRSERVEATGDAEAAPASCPRGDATVLVAEDEVAVRMLVTSILRRQGYRVIEAKCGTDALEQWATHRAEVDLLLSDVVMPGKVDGHELAARLAADKPALRVLLMSGYDPSQLASAGETLKPQLRKPFTADELLAAVAQALRGG